MNMGLPTGTDPASVLMRIEAMEMLLERGFTIPLINRKFGLDALIGLIPVVGDLITAGMGAYIIWEARNLGMPKWKVWRMAGNVAFDTAIGAIPLAGDTFDFFFRSNTRNLKIVKKHLHKHHPEAQVIEG
ncbi:DUF4112 domain-containing protein [Altericroceibacterium endophyticum]